jgi:hypothetical protein
MILETMEEEYMEHSQAENMSNSCQEPPCSNSILLSPDPNHLYDNNNTIYNLFTIQLLGNGNVSTASSDYE